MALHRLLYASTARAGLGPDDIADIVATAQRVNAELSVTGHLAFDGMAFAQILEGDGDTIKDLYAKIRRDRRHSGCVLLSFVPAAERRFDGWSMGYRRLTDLLMIQELTA